MLSTFKGKYGLSYGFARPLCQCSEVFARLVNLRCFEQIERPRALCIDVVYDMQNYHIAQLVMLPSDLQFVSIIGS